MKKLFILSLALLGLSLFSCEDEKNATLEIWLTDAPGDYQEVNIDLIGVEVHSSPTDQGGGWQALDAETGRYNLLDLTNGRETLLGKLSLPGGKISQIRLLLGENNTIKVHDHEHALGTPSAQQSGLKLQVHEVLLEGITYKMLLDFDAAKSIVEHGNDVFSLKPVIRVITAAQDGAVKGMVSGVSAPVAVSALADAEVVATAYSDGDGNFLLRGLAPGTYTLIFDPGANAAVTEKSGVTISLGTVTDVGTIEIR